MEYDDLVVQCIRAGATRADAEAQAREILFGSADEEGMRRKELNDIDEALWLSCTKLSFEDCCAQVDAAMCDGGGGTEVLLRRATGFLADGTISESQFEALLARAEAAPPPVETGSGSASSAAAAVSGSSSSEDALVRAATQIQAGARGRLARSSAVAAAAEGRQGTAAAALVVQTRWRAHLGRSHVARTRLEQLERRSELHWGARTVQAAVHALKARRALRRKRRAAVAMQAHARARRRKPAWT